MWIPGIAGVLRKRTVKKTDALSGKHSWLLATNVLKTL